MHGFQTLCVNMAALTTAVMCPMKSNANAVNMRKKYDLNINIPVIHNSYSTPGILFLTLKGSTILSHVPTLKFRLDGELYNLHSHSSRRPGLFMYTSKHLYVLP